MTGSPNPITDDETLDDPTQSLRSSRHRHNTMTNGNTNGHGQQPMAWDVPPLVASPNGGSNTVWRTRSCKIITPQRLGTILLLSDHEEEEEQFQHQQHQDSSFLESELSENEDHDHDHYNDSPVPLVRGDSFSSPSNDGPLVGGTTFPPHSLSTRKLADTTSCSCPPLIWKLDYIVVALITGKIQMYRLYDDEPVVASQSSSHTTITSPISTLTLPSDATIVAMVQSGKDSLVLLSGEGHVHHIQVEENIGTLVLEQSWDTGSCGASCLTVMTQENHQDHHLLIGYSTGQIECYRWQPHGQEGGLGRGGGGGGARRKRRKPPCCWKGWMDEWHAVESMQILSCPQMSTSTSTLTSTQHEGVKNDNTDKQDEEPIDKGQQDTTATNDKSFFPILLVTLQSSIGGDDRPLIQALDLNAIHSHAASIGNTTTRSTNITSEPHHDKDDFLVLEAFRVLPDPAMGIIESSSAVSLPSPLKLHSGIIPSQGTNQIISLAGKCGVALSNGTIAILSPGWGVENDADQLQLAYPAIGMGTFYWKETEYFVCCLRAGTCYLMPIKTTATLADVIAEDPSVIPVVLYPHDIDTDTTHVYVQSFTAGSLRVPGHPSLVLPVLVYVFPGGIIDIYSCHLLPCSSIRSNNLPPLPPIPSEEDQVLEAMVEEGCLDMILQVFDRNLAMDDPLWNDAKLEWQTLVPHQVEQRSDMSSSRHLQKLQNWKDYPALRTLLLHLSSTPTS